jgi:hypothetical protein
MTKAERQSNLDFLARHAADRKYAGLIAQYSYWAKRAQVAKDEAEQQFCTREAGLCNAKLRRREKQQV